MSYYAVANGRKAGVYSNWDECRAQVDRFSGSRYKKFSSAAEANNFIQEHSSAPTVAIPSVSRSSPPRRNYSYQSTGYADHKYPAQSNPRRESAAYEDTESTYYSKQDKMHFDKDKDGYVDVFTDGACSSNGYKNARAGIGVWFKDNHPLNLSRPVEGRATNNMAEIQAVTEAARQAKKAGIKNLRINTDSQFLISCKTQWMDKWKQRDWKTADNKPVINKAELIEMEKELAPLNVKWNHVNGHAGIHGNEMADKLAKEGCLQYK